MAHDASQTNTTTSHPSSRTAFQAATCNPRYTSGKLALAMVVVAGVAVLFTNLGGPRLWDRDEPRNAGCAAEMLARGDWVVPTFNQELRTHKPILLYWLMMASYSLFGVTEFAARLPSALCGIGTVLVTYGIGRRLFGPAAGTWAGIVLTSTLMFAVAGRAATPDSVLIFLTTLAIGIYVWGAFPRLHSASTHSESDVSSCVAQPGGSCDTSSQPAFWPRTWSTVVAMNLAMGAAVLAKGPIGVVLPTAVIGLFLLFRWHEASPRQNALHRFIVWPVRHFLATCWRMRPLTALTVVLAVALPWYVLVGIRTDGAWLRGFFFDHNLGRAMQPMEGHDGSTLLYYPLALLIGFFPWSIFAAPLVVHATSQVRGTSRDVASYQLPVCWVAVYLGLFSIAQTKLPSYITPCYPAAALLMGAFIDRWVRGAVAQRPVWIRLAWGSSVLVGLTMTIGLGIAAWILLPQDVPVAAIGLLPLLGGLVAWRLAETDQRTLAVATYGVMSVLLTTLAFGWIADRVDRHQKRHELLAEIHRRADEPIVGGFGFLEPSWVFYWQQPIIELRVEPTESPLKVNPYAKRVATLQDFIRNEKQPFVITTASQLQQLGPQLPHDFGEVARVPNFLKEDPIVLIGRTQPQTADRQHSPAEHTELR